MNVLIDIVHPAHVHFYRHMTSALEAGGHSVKVVARDKDVTLSLLERYGIPHVSVGRSAMKNRIGQAQELVMRDVALLRIARRFKPDVVLTRNPSGCQVARAIRSIGIFDTDEGSAAGLLFRAAAPFAKIITTPDCSWEDYGRKHRKYPGYKTLAYLHPSRFTPDPSVLDELGVSPGEPYALVRFVSLVAVHDRGESGLPLQEKIELVRRLRKTAKVFVTSEGPLPADIEDARLRVASVRAHDALAFASLCVGDSPTMASEAAVLGVPALHCSSRAARLYYLVELEERYGLIKSFSPRDASTMIRLAEQMLDDRGSKEEWAARRERMLSEKVDVTSWYLDLLEELG